jgi:hypothetical protein
MITFFTNATGDYPLLAGSRAVAIGGFFYSNLKIANRTSSAKYSDLAGLDGNHRLLMRYERRTRLCYHPYAWD